MHSSRGQAEQQTDAKFDYETSSIKPPDNGNRTTMKGYLDVAEDGIRSDVYWKLNDLDYPDRTLQENIAKYILPLEMEEMEAKKKGLVAKEKPKEEAPEETKPKAQEEEWVPPELRDPNAVLLF